MRFSGQPSSRAISMRTNDGLCDAVWMVSELSVDSGHRDQRLERRMHHLLGAEAMLEHMIGRLDGFFEVSLLK